MRYTLRACFGIFALFCCTAPAAISATNSTVEMVAGGTGLGGAQDLFTFQSSPVSGNFDFKIRVQSLTLADPWSEAALMARETTAQNSRFAAAVATPSISGCLFKMRITAGQPSTMNGSFPANYPQTWLRLRRSGSSFTAYAGFDGTNWIKLGGGTIPMAASVQVGYGAASHSTNTTTAVFSDFGPVDSTDVIVGPQGIEPLGQSSRFTSLIFSEIMYHPPERADGRKLEFIEILNTLATPQDIGGYRISGDVDFTFPAGSVLAGGAFAVVARNPADLEAVYNTRNVYGPFDKGKSLPNDDGRVRLRNRQDAILLEVDYGSRAPWPEAADGAGASLVLARPSYGEGDPRAWEASAGGTPGAINTRLSVRSLAPPPPSQGASVTFNEIMYHPISGDDDDQYVELFNKSNSTVDLTGWKVEGGIEYAFPAGVMIARGSYLVVARNADRLRTNYPALNSGNSTGNFSGRLSHSGEPLRLTRPGTGTEPPLVIEDELAYADGGQWGDWADGGGSSLEKIDSFAGSPFASNWAGSDESSKAPWTEIAITGRLDNGNVGADQLQILLQGAGECLVDDVQVVNEAGSNFVPNSTFDSPSEWIAEGTEKNSTWEQREGGGLFHLRAVERGDNQVNRVRTALSPRIAANTTATIKARVRWLKGSPHILFRLRGNWLEAAARMNLPSNLGTPGEANSRRVAGAGPAISDVRHFPVLPEANQPVVVSARVSDPDGIDRVIVRYRTDPATTDTGLTMRDDGTGGDEVAGDGIYSRQIPAQSAGTLVAFTVVATDPQNHLNTFPALNSGRKCLVRFGEEMPSGNFPVYRIWMTEATLNEWTFRPKLDNTPLDVTFVLGNSRVIYGAKALYAGSPYIAPGYSSPQTGACGYTVTLPGDDRFLGSTALVLDWPGGHGGERTALQEQMAYWLAEQMNLPYSHRYHIRLVVNGITDLQRGTVFEAVNQPDGDFLKAWQPDDSDGDFYKIDRGFEFSDFGGLVADPQPRLQRYVTVGGEKKTARYRWNWMKRSSDDPDNYSNIFDLVDAVNAVQPEPYTGLTESLVDIDEWMGMLAFEHIIVNFDAYGHEIGKNMYAYKPIAGKWQLYAFDLDWLMLAAAGRLSNYSPNSAPLYNSEDPTISRMYNHPPFRRAYLQAVQNAIPAMESSVVDPVMDAKYRSLVANGITVCDYQTLTDPAAVKTWFARRRTALMNAVLAASPAFALTVNGGNDFSTNTTQIELTGTAPLNAKKILVNGVERQLAWDTVSTWRLSVGLNPGPNVLRVTAADSAGVELASAQITVTNAVGTRPILAATMQNGAFMLAWLSENSIQYSIEYTDDLGRLAWTPLQSVTGTGQTVSISIDPAGRAERFYRVRRSP